MPNHSTPALTDAQLAEWAEVAEKATPGPWTADTNVPHDIVVWGPPCPTSGDGADPDHDGSELVFNVGESFVQVGSPAAARDVADAHFIALARTAFPLVLAELRRVRAEMAKAKPAATPPPTWTVTDMRCPKCRNVGDVHVRDIVSNDNGDQIAECRQCRYSWRLEGADA